MGKDVSTLAWKAVMIYNSRKKCRKVRYDLRRVQRDECSL